MNIDPSNPLALPLYFTGAAVFSALLIVVLALWRRSRRVVSLDLKLLRVQVAQSNREQNMKTSQYMFEEINRTEVLLSALSAMKKPFAIEVAVHHTGEDINFYLAVPEDTVDFATREIHGVFPDSRIDRVEDFSIFGAQSAAAGAYLALKERYVLPIRTYREAEADTFGPILSTFSRLSAEEEGASIQFIVEPAHADKDAKKGILDGIQMLRKGVKLSDVTRTALLKAKDFKFLMESDSKEGEAKPVDDQAVQALVAKGSKPLFAVNVRVMAAAPTKDRAEDVLMAISGSLSQFTSPMRNQVQLVKPHDIRALVSDYVFRKFDSEQAVILNTEEIASMFHFPTFSSEVPRITWAKTNEAPAPNNLPEAGTVIGESTYRGDNKLIRLTDEDRRRHLYIVGQTGAGKSLLMETIIRRDMEAGKGLCLIDPHGETVDHILGWIPKNRIDDVIYFNPGDLSRPLGLNMLEFNSDRPEEKSFIVGEIQSIFNQLFDKATMGPMFENYMRNALLLLMEDAKNEPATLMEVPRIFTDEAYRRRKLARISNPAVIDFWEKEVAKTSGDQGLGNMAPYITSKFGNFIANDYMRPIIGQTKSAFNFREAMDSGKILLISLAKGRIGDLNSQLLGMIIVGRILLAALSRGDIANEKDRRDFYLYIDEFQNYSTDSIAVILSEARKYHLNLIIAHQFIAQLKDNIREAVFGNVGNLVSFRVGAPDTEQLLKTFGPEFTQKDLISVQNCHGFIKMLIDGQPARPFDFNIIFPPKGSPEVRDKMKELSRLTYGRDLADVEQDIMRRLRS